MTEVFESAGLGVAGRTAEGDWVALELSTGLTGPRWYDRAGCRRTCFPILLVAHITLAVALFLPSILLPFTLRTRRAAVDSESGVVRSLLWAQSHGTVVIGAGLRSPAWGWSPRSGRRCSNSRGCWWRSSSTRSTWLAFFIQRPNLRRLIGVKAAADDGVWRERAKRQRYVSYLMAGLVGVIGFLMSTKPSL